MTLIDPRRSVPRSGARLPAASTSSSSKAGPPPDLAGRARASRPRLRPTAEVRAVPTPSAAAFGDRRGRRQSRFVVLAFGGGYWFGTESRPRSRPSGSCRCTAGTRVALPCASRTRDPQATGRWSSRSTSLPTQHDPPRTHELWLTATEAPRAVRQLPCQRADNDRPVERALQLQSFSGWESHAKPRSTTGGQHCRSDD